MLRPTSLGLDCEAIATSSLVSIIVSVMNAEVAMCYYWFDHDNLGTRQFSSFQKGYDDDQRHDMLPPNYHSVQGSMNVALDMNS